MVSPVDLPEDVLHLIFSRLSVSDRIQVSRVCKAWNGAVRARWLNNNATITFRDDEEFAKGFSSLASAAHTSYHRLAISGVTLRPGGANFEALLPRLSFLELRGCQVTERDLTAILLRCSGLAHLGLVDAREVFIAGIFLDDAGTRNELKEVLSGVKSLDLSKNSYMTDSLFNRITSCTRKLVSLRLDDCKTINHAGIYKKFYPTSSDDGESPAYNSPSVFTFRCVLQFISSRSGAITALSLRNTGIDGLAVQHLCSVDGLRLRSLDVGMCSSVSQDAVWELAKKQNDLRSLNLDYCRMVFADYPATSQEIFSELSNCRELSLVGLSIPKELDLFLAVTKKLRRLNLSALDAIPRLLVDGLAKSESSLTLESLTLSNFGCSPENLERLFQGLPNLTYIDVSNCQEGVTDRALQEIACGCRRLKTLRMDRCRRLTDLGFTGSASPVLEKAPDVIEEAKREGKIFPGTRAEAAIINQSKVEDAVRKAVAAEAGPTSGALSSSASLIEHLLVTAAAITDVSISRAFRFACLRSVDLSLNERITDAGFCALGQLNPGLESAVLKQCSLTDAGLVGLISNTPRLTLLDVEGCKELTSEGISHLPGCTRDLRHLDVSFCLKVKTAAVDLVCALLPQLRSPGVRGLHIAECMEDYEGEKPKYKSPPPPPTPPRL